MTRTTDDPLGDAWDALTDRERLLAVASHLCPEVVAIVRERDAENERLRAEVERLGSREFARIVAESFSANFLDGDTDGGMVTLKINVLLSEIRHSVRFAIEDATGRIPA